MSMRRIFRNWGGRPWWFWRKVADRRARLASEGGEVVDYSAEADTLFAAMTSAPDDTRKALIDDLILALKTGATSGSDIWAKMGGLWVMAAHDSQAARLNWKNPGTNTLTAVNSPTFTADAGYASNGTTSYLDAGATHSTFGVTTNSAHLGSWMSGTGTSVFGVGRADANGCYSLGMNNSSTYQARLSLTTAVSIAANTVVAAYHFATRRLNSGAGAVEMYQNGVSVGTNAQGASNVGSGNLHLLKSNTSYSPATAKIEIAHLGVQLSAAEQLDCYNAFAAYRAGL